MEHQPSSASRAPCLSPGLYLVATPIGAARDITLRALDILRAADVIAAEDTRTARRLMEIHGIPVAGRPLIAYHDHSGPGRRAGLLEHIGAGRSVAYVSEAGTPMVADPGYQLVRAAAEQGMAVQAAPGASAMLTALCVSGLPSDRFLFVGFPPQAKGALESWCKELRDVQATLIIYESPKRIYRLLEILIDTLGGERDAALCRELTKKFEEVLRGTLADLRDSIADRSLKGEIVLLVDRGVVSEASDEVIEKALRAALAQGSVKDAARDVAEAMGLPRRKLYQMALALSAATDRRA